MSFIKYTFLCAAMIFGVHSQSVFAQHEGHTPAKPAATPTPAAPTPAATPKSTTPQPAATPEPAASPSATPQSTDAMQPDEPVHMDHGVFVMHGDQMFIRVGHEESNLIPMGRMGSGTSWQPASTPM